MPPFRRPTFDADFPVDAAREIRALRVHAKARGIPKRTAGKLLIATWNIANLGVQQRADADYAILAEIIGWFDLVAIQETNDNLSGLRAIVDRLPSNRRILVSEAGGNLERGAFVYDARKVTLLDKVGRLSIAPKDLAKIKPPGTTEPFQGFDRGPYMAAFASRGEFRFLLVNVHLFFGGDTADEMQRRTQETFALARWAQLRHNSPNAYVPDIIPLGDFNLPQMEPSDPIFRELTRRGLRLPQEHAISRVGGTSLQGLNHYDQVALFPTQTTELDEIAVFDFDNAIFADVFKAKTLKQFLGYVRFHASDHRPLWAQFSI